MRRLATLVLWLSTALWPSLAWGESPRPHTAVLVVPHDQDAVVREIVVRLRGELAAAGFAVSLAERDSLARPREEIERTAGESSATAVIMVRPEQAEAPFVDLWISDRVLGATSNLHLSSDHPDPSERARRLSVQAVEVLRARLAELLLAPGDAARRPTPQQPREQALSTTASPVAAAERSRQAHLEFGAGAALSRVRSLAATRWMPAVQAALVWSRDDAHAPQLVFGVGVLATGYGRAVHEHGERGTAQLSQGWGLAQLLLRLSSRFPLEPELALSAGVYGIAVEGDADPPYEAHRLRSFSPLVGAGAALRARLGSRFSLRAASDLLHASSHAFIHVAGERVARAGGLLVSMRLELSVTLW